ncbi:MAG: hypothetical protein FD174_2186 [Geobacteraceae bacterium]|nr:MAG: hypothetical protein FD174_2186 [Geobacteraceae bacterium]
MRNRVNGVFVVLTLMLSALIWSGCSKQSQTSGKDVSKAQSQYSGKGVSKTQLQPSDEDIIKAIDDSGIMKREDGSLTVVPPVKVVEKGKLDKGGAWPVKVKFTLKYKMKDGRTAPPKETTTSFRIFEEKDSAGKSVWKAQLGT